MDVTTYRKREARLRIKNQEIKKKKEKEEKVQEQREDHKNIIKTPLMPKSLRKTADLETDNASLV